MTLWSLTLSGQSWSPAATWGLGVCGGLLNELLQPASGTVQVNTGIGPVTDRWAGLQPCRSSLETWFKRSQYSLLAVIAKEEFNDVLCRSPTSSVLQKTTMFSGGRFLKLEKYSQLWWKTNYCRAQIESDLKKKWNTSCFLLSTSYLIWVSLVRTLVYKHAAADAGCWFWKCNLCADLYWVVTEHSEQVCGALNTRQLLLWKSRWYHRSDMKSKQVAESVQSRILLHLRLFLPPCGGAENIGVSALTWRESISVISVNHDPPFT